MTFSYLAPPTFLGYVPLPSYNIVVSRASPFTREEGSGRLYIAVLPGISWRVNHTYTRRASMYTVSPRAHGRFNLALSE